MIQFTKAVVATSLLAVAAASAFAGKDAGAFQVLLPGGGVLKGKTFVNIQPKELLGPVRVRGTYVEFDIDPNTFTVSNYTLTGARAAIQVVKERTVVFKEKAPLHGTKLSSGMTVTINNEQIVIMRGGNDIRMKIQAKDASQGGLFQMEPSRTIAYRHTLASDFYYYTDQFGRVMLTNGRFVCRESPEVATLLNPTPKEIFGKTVSMWSVSAGGRMGFVVGEDAIQP